MEMIEHKEECQICNGTGLYVGMAERDGAAVVCYNCKGTGCFVFKRSYTPFRKRKPRSDVLRVFQVNPGIGIGASKGFALADFGGVPHDEWTRTGRFSPGSEDRRHTCPAWWYQSADYKKKPEWKECGFGAFSACEHFGNKAKCWERFDLEHRTEATTGEAK